MRYIMLLPAQWATPEDFATLFQYLWYRDFPVSQSAVGARRSDWTIHIGLVVRGIADLLGFHARFESGHRKDAVLRSGEGDEIAVEWEWGGAWGNELKKLKEHRGWTPTKDPDHLLKYAVLITYTNTADIEKDYGHVTEKWEGARWPLLLILIDVEESKTFLSGKEFKSIKMSIFDSCGQRDIRSAPAFPWKIGGSRWSVQPN